MELGGKGKVTHKLTGVKSSFPGFASFSCPTKTSACSDWHRQQNSNDLYTYIHRLYLPMVPFQMAKPSDLPRGRAIEKIIFLNMIF